MRIFLAVVAAILVSPSPARADTGSVTWTVRTASNSYGNDRSSFSYAVNPGGRALDGMVVANRGKAPLKLAVYAADGFTSGSGQLGLRDHSASSALGTWISAASSITVPAGRSVSVPFTVAVPANATPGDYVGGIVTSLTQPDSQAGINVERRLGIRIKLRVGGALAPAVTIENPTIAYAGSPFSRGSATVSYTVRNIGNATLSASQAVAASGPFGWFRASALPDISDMPDLLPGESRSVSVPVHGITPAFLLTGPVTLTPLITDASGSTTTLPAVHASAHGWAVPWTWLVLIAVLIVLVVWLLRRRATRKRREDARVRAAVEKALAAN